MLDCVELQAIVEPNTSSSTIGCRKSGPRYEHALAWHERALTAAAARTDAAVTRTDAA
jgi:hypothetical protein